MKRLFSKMIASALCAMALPLCANAGNQQTVAISASQEMHADSIIQLPQPDKSLNVSLMQALSDRKSQREFSDKPISMETLSSLLWAANGVNRADGRRTAPSAVNSQDIDIYVCMADGAYLYKAKENQLVLVCKEDLRKTITGRQPMDAPVILLLVADISRYPQGLASQRENVEPLANMDAGYVSANIGLYCAAAKLATVPRAMMDKEALSKALKLTGSQFPILNNPVGFPK